MPTRGAAEQGEKNEKKEKKKKDAPKTVASQSTKSLDGAIRDAVKMKALWHNTRSAADALANSIETIDRYAWARTNEMLGTLRSLNRALDDQTDKFEQMLICDLSVKKGLEEDEQQKMLKDAVEFLERRPDVVRLAQHHARIVRMRALLA